eukprot:3704477-Ditylum_brightwellii.AAC.1
MNEYGNNKLLDIACDFSEEVEVIYLLLDKWIGAKENRNILVLETLEDKSCSGDLYHCVSDLINDFEVSNTRANDIVSFFIQARMWNSVFWVVDTYPITTKFMKLQTNEMGDFLAMELLGGVEYSINV